MSYNTTLDLVFLFINILLVLPIIDWLSVWYPVLDFIRKNININFQKNLGADNFISNIIKFLRDTIHEKFFNILIYLVGYSYILTTDIINLMGEIKWSNAWKLITLMGHPFLLIFFCVIDRNMKIYDLSIQIMHQKLERLCWNIKKGVQSC